MVADMLQMSRYGSTGTETLKNEIDKIFELFEENSLLQGECSSIIREALLELEDMYEYIGTEEEMINSRLRRFVLQENKDGQQILKSHFTKCGHMSPKSINPETLEIPFNNYTHLNENSLKVVQNLRKNVVSDVMETVKTRLIMMINLLGKQLYLKKSFLI